MTRSTAELYEFAEDNGITVDTLPLRSVEAFSISCADGRCFVALNADDPSFEKEKLAHELGHCMTGSFYDAASAYETRERLERRADRWAFRQIVPPEALREAFRNGLVDAWSLAEAFDVSEDFMRRACEYYRVRGEI